VTSLLDDRLIMSHFRVKSLVRHSMRSISPSSTSVIAAPDALLGDGRRPATQVIDCHAFRLQSPRGIRYNHSAIWAHITSMTPASTRQRRAVPPIVRARLEMFLSLKTSDVREAAHLAGYWGCYGHRSLGEQTYEAKSTWETAIQLLGISTQQVSRNGAKVYMQPARNSCPNSEQRIGR